MSRHLLQAMRFNDVKKLILASTSSLYAGLPMPFTEDRPVDRPLSPYAASKKAAEVLAYTYHHLFDLDVSILRYFTVYGPAGRPDMAPFRFIRWIDEGVPIEMFGDGSQARDFTYVDDIARGTILAAKPLGYEIINLGGGKRPTSLMQLIDAINATEAPVLSLDTPSGLDVTSGDAPGAVVRAVDQPGGDRIVRFSLETFRPERRRWQLVLEL